MSRPLPGFRDFPPERLRERKRVLARLRQTAEAFGFEEYDGPVLEPLELYTEKSGDEIVGQVFSFEDRGGRRVALRPEMTPTLARMAGGAAATLRRPSRWFAINEQYRFERPQKGRQRAFTQFNLDVLGEPSAGADAEVVSCFVAALERCGLTEADVRVRLSDRRIWTRFLDLMGVDRADQTECLSAIDKMDRLSPEKLAGRIEPVLGEGTADFLARVEEFRSLRGEGALLPFLESLSSRAEENRVSAELVGAWKEFRATLDAMGLGAYAVLDLGIVRGLAYYTGPVFEVFEASGEGRAIAGGGRYDDLVGKVSGSPLEATGGALGDVTLLDLLADRGRLDAPGPSVDCFVAIGGPGARPSALALVGDLRRAGLSTLYSFREAGFSRQFKDANRSAARAVVSVGDREMAEGIYPVKDLSTGEETRIPKDDLVEGVRRMIRG